MARFGAEPRDLTAQWQPDEADVDRVPQLVSYRVPAAGVVGEDLEGDGQERDHHEHAVGREGEAVGVELDLGSPGMSS